MTTTINNEERKTFLSRLRYAVADIGSSNLIRSIVVEASISLPGEDLINASEVENCSFLCMACKYKHENAALTLIDLGAKVNVVTDDLSGVELKETPFLIAARLGMTRVLKALKDKGADINAKTELGTSALHYASRFGHLEAVKYLVSLNSPIDVRDDLGMTPLMYAARKGRILVVQFLLFAGAAIGAKDIEGYTLMDRPIGNKLVANWLRQWNKEDEI